MWQGWLWLWWNRESWFAVVHTQNCTIIRLGSLGLAHLSELCVSVKQGYKTNPPFPLMGDFSKESNYQEMLLQTPQTMAMLALAGHRRLSKPIRVGRFVHFPSFEYCLFRRDCSLFVCLSFCLSHEHLLHASFFFFILLKSITACYLAEARNFLHQVSHPKTESCRDLSEMQALEWVFCLPVHCLLIKQRLCPCWILLTASEITMFGHLLRVPRHSSESRFNLVIILFNQLEYPSMNMIPPSPKMIWHMTLVTI